MEGRGDCEYGDTTCDCQNDAWVCWEIALGRGLPRVRTASPVGMQCDYGQDNCDCENTGWDCGGAPRVTEAAAEVVAEAAAAAAGVVAPAAVAAGLAMPALAPVVATEAT